MLKGQLRRLASSCDGTRHHTRCSTQQRSQRFAGSRCVMSSCQQAQMEVSASTSPNIELGRRQLFLATTMVIAGTLPARADPEVEAVSSSTSAAEVLAASAPDMALDTQDLETMPTPISSPASEPSSSPASTSVASTPSTGNGPVVYLDVKLEGKPLGRVAIQLFDDTSTGAQRFRDLAIGKQGVGYRLSRFDRILPTYIRCEGVKSLSYSATMDSPITGGDSLEALEEELQAQTRTHDSAGLVSLVVAEENERPIKEKLIAKNGKLVTITQQAGEAPNGTTFMITRAADPALDATNLIVGRVVQGMDVVEAIGALPFARPRDSYYDSPFFSVAKAIGDKRADTAEKGFNRPLKRVIVSASGLADSV